MAEEWEKFKWAVLLERVSWLEKVVWEIRERRDQGVEGSGMGEIEQGSQEAISWIYRMAREFLEEVLGRENLNFVLRWGVEWERGRGWWVEGRWVRGREEWEEEVADMLLRELVFLRGEICLL